jgi:2-oxoglutarate dehydrogenase E1 component
VVHLAAEWRQTFHRDVVIDLYCFRRHGHNEGDEPSFTQPLLYDAIRAHPSPRVAYARRMVAERRSLTEEEVNRIVAESQSRLEEALTAPREEPGARGNGWRFEGSVWDEVDTRVPLERLQALLTQMNDLPTGFSAHRKIQRLLEQRVAIARGERPVDWAVAELGAYATLVDQGRAVRLSGQDSGRGTFSHRHAVLTDVISGLDHVPLAHLREGQGTFEVYDSLLSEAAVLGFEYGYTLESPDTLVLWEAQFGDFANGAQVIIDNFLMSSEQKWNLCSGLVMLLPHGYEGQGPEHSSARLERYLQLCAEENVVVANITTPANFFHLLRRQSLQRVRKPLVVMSPKSLLRHAECVSTLEELSEGHYQRVISETDADVRIESVHRVVGGPPRPGCLGRGPHPAGAALPAARRRDLRRARRRARGRRGRLVPGRAPQHGRLAADGRVDVGGARRSPSAVHRAPSGRRGGHRISQAPPHRAGRPHRRGPRPAPLSARRPRRAPSTASFEHWNIGVNWNGC